MEKSKMMGGLLLSTAAALVCIPLITRHLGPRELALATIVLVAHALFGVLDTFRPVVVRRVAQNRKFATARNLLLPSGGYAVLIVAAAAAAWALFLPEYGFLHYLSFAAALALFIIYVPLWGLIEAHGGVGSGYLVRAVSTAALYAFFAIAGLLDGESLLLVALPAVHLASALAFAWLARSHIVASGVPFERSYIAEAGHVFAQNVAKIITDFADRLAVSLVSPPLAIAAYNLNYEITSKFNVVSQLFTSYYYPVVCGDTSVVPRLLSIGMLVSSGIAVSALLIYAFGEPLYLLYFGEQLRGYFPVFCSLLAVAAVYSMSFFGQAALRSLGKDRDLSIVFLLSAIAGAGFIGLFLAIGNLLAAVLAALFFRSSAVLMMHRLRRWHRWCYPFTIAVFLGALAFVLALVGPVS